MKNTLIFIAFVLVVLGLLFAISGSRAPQIQRDAIHNGLSSDAPCMECHGIGMPNARKPGHPPKDECLKCHRFKRVRKG